MLGTQLVVGKDLTGTKAKDGTLRAPPGRICHLPATELDSSVFTVEY